MYYVCPCCLSIRPCLLSILHELLAAFVKGLDRFVRKISQPVLAVIEEKKRGKNNCRTREAGAARKTRFLPGLLIAFFSSTCYSPPLEPVFTHRPDFTIPFHVHIFHLSNLPTCRINYYLLEIPDWHFFLRGPHSISRRWCVSTAIIC